MWSRQQQENAGAADIYMYIYITKILYRYMYISITKYIYICIYITKILKMEQK